MPFDNDNRDRVLAASDIVDVVGEHVALRPKGREFAAVCCFHDDTSPSMFVSPQKQIFKCFVCGAGGSVFDFVMKYHKMSFPEALRFLADRSGIELKRLRPGGGPGSGGGEAGGAPTPTERVNAANRAADAFFRTLLQHEEHGSKARAYIERRGITPEMVERFGIGVAPDRWDGLVQMIQSRGWSLPDFELAELVRARKSGGGHFDMLRNRLIFPIRDGIGRVIAFGGRRLDEADEPKYLNSPETRVFQKSKTLYGLDLAKKPIIDSGTAVLVEGYTDVIACHQHGAANVVAALGTALTPEHATMLKRFCDRVVLVMDGDAAGQRAADRAIDIFVNGEIDVCLVSLPGGRDPDEFLSAEDGGLGAWNHAVAEASDALSWQIERLREAVGASDSLSGQQKLTEAFLQRVLDAGLLAAQPMRREMLTGRVAELLGVSPSAVEDQMKLMNPRPTPQRPSRAGGARRAHGASASPQAAAGSGSPATGARSPQPEAFPGEGAEEHPGGWEEMDSELDFDPGSPYGDPLAPEDLSPEAGSENRSDPVASRGGRSRLAGVEAAECRLIAAFIQQPDLLRHRLPDGGELAETLTPGDFPHPEYAALYQMLLDRVASRQPLTLALLMGDAAEAEAEAKADSSNPSGLHAALMRIADEAASPEAGSESNTSPAAEAEAAAHTLLHHLAEDAYRTRRHAITDLLRSADQQTPPPEGAAEQARHLLDHLRSRSSPLRIGKPG